MAVTETNAKTKQPVKSAPDKRPVVSMDWQRVRQSNNFKELVQMKKRFIVPATIFFFAFYFLLPILTSYTTVLNANGIGALNLAFLYAFAQFAMTWILCVLYARKADRFDKLAQQVIDENAEVRK